MSNFESNLDFCQKELIEIINLFENAESLKIKHIFSQNGNKLVNAVVINGKTYAYGNLVGKFKSEIESKRIIKRYAKLSIYKALSSLLNVNLPWGALTGVRPTKLAYQELSSNPDFTDFFINTMKISPQKTQLIQRVIENQKGIYTTNSNFTDLFVFIPFCPSRCKYCSFITHDLKHSGEYQDKFVDCLVEEIKNSKKLIKNLRSIYIGGGTPVALSDSNLERVLVAIDEINSGVEYTVEAGRPDKITKSNLELLKKHGVTRLCINPQTFNDQTLKLIGRNHTANDVVEKFNLAKDSFIINMDLIAGLDGESVKDFMDSVDKAISLSPENITIHTLSVKHGSNLKSEVKRLPKGDIEEMILYAENKLSQAGYNPYYIYRQKYMAGNLENVGYAKPKTECVYNVDVMEETVDVVACGAGAISKKINFSEEKIIRIPEPKDVKTYIEKYKKIIEEKENTFL